MMNDFYTAKQSIMYKFCCIYLHYFKTRGYGVPKFNTMQIHVYNVSIYIILKHARGSGVPKLSTIQIQHTILLM